MLTSIALGLFALTSSTAAPLVQAADGITIRSEDTLNELLADYSAARELSVTYDQTVAEALIRLRTGLLSDLEVAQEEYEGVVEGLVASQGFGLSEVPIPGTRVLLAHLVSQAPKKWSALEVETREQLVRHPALRLHYTTSFPSLDPRQFSAVLRPVLGEADALVIKAGPGCTLEGSGTRIADLTAVLFALEPTLSHEAFEFEPDSAFEPISQALELDGVETMLDLLRAYDEVTELHLVVTEAARAELRKQHLGSHEASIPGDALHSFVSSMLFARGFATSLAGELAPHLFVVDLESPSTALRNLPATYTTLEQFERLPALRVMVPVTLRHADPRRLPIILRSHPSMNDDLFALSLGGSQGRCLIGGRSGDLASLWPAIVAADKP